MTQTYTPKQIGTNANWSAIAAGRDYTIALQSSTLWAWGDGSSGQLGLGDEATGNTDKNRTPRQIAGANWIAIAARSGAEHTIAIKSDGTLWAWGLNSSGQLGDGTTTNKNTPVQIATGYSYSSTPTPNTTPTLTPTPTPTPSPTPSPKPKPSPSPTPPPYEVTENKRYGEELKIGDPIDAGSGAYSFTLPMLNSGGPMGLGFDLFYRSNNENWQDRKPNDFPGDPSRFWWGPRCRLYPGADIRTVWFEDGSMALFNTDGSLNEKSTKSTPNNGQPVQYVMKDTTGYVYVMDPVKEKVHVFQKTGTETAQGRIRSVMDRNNNYLQYTYEDDSHNNPSKIEDNTGRQLNFSYGDHDASSKEAYFLDTVTDQAGRKVSFGYVDNASDNGNTWTLRSVTDPMDAQATFSYSTVSKSTKTIRDNIAEVTYPAGNTPYLNTYKAVKDGNDVSARVDSQTDAYGNTTTIKYKDGKGKDTTVKTTASYPDDSKDVYEHFSSNSPPKGYTDAAGKTAKFKKNEHEQITSITDRMGDAIKFTYHTESGKRASATNAKDGTVKYTYTAQEQSFTNPDNGETVSFTFYNLTRTDYPDNTGEQFTYDSKGNMSGRTDRAWKQWQYEYSSTGQVTKITNSTGGTTEYTYNTDATVSSSKDSDTGTTSYEYDTYKRLTKITHPDGGYVQMAHDLNDRVTSVTDENGHTYTYTYDANGNLTKTTDPAGKETTYTYDLLDRVTKVTDRLGKQSSMDYNEMGQLSTTTDPTDIETRYGYDPRRWLNEVSAGGKTRQTGYDNEGIVSSRKTPLGYKTSIQSDKLGYTSAVTDPLGYTTTFTRDALNRITGSTDPLNRTTGFTYDSRGLLSGVTMPEIGTTTYARNDIGLLSQITDLNGWQWSFTYTKAGRQESQTDPLNRAWQFAYNTRGRLNKTTYPDGGTQTTTYDAAGNVTKILYGDGTDLQYTYDTLNRITAANNVQFTRDAEGRTTNTADASINFGAGYDDAGRLKTAAYNNGTFTVTYSYDNTTGLLTGVTDSLTGAKVDFTYDDDFRLTSITRSNGVNATFTRDDASRLTRIQDGSIIDLQYTPDAAGQVRKVSIKTPLDPADSLTDATDAFTYDATCQVSTAGYTYDQRGRLIASPDDAFGWDGASRLTGIGATALAYNGLNDLVTRSEAGQTMHFYYNKAIGLTPVVAEKNDLSGQFVRYYVWTPNGRLLYMIDASDNNKVYFYHFDHVGSTLALTNVDGTVTDSLCVHPLWQASWPQRRHSAAVHLRGDVGGEAGGFIRQPLPYEGQVL